MTAALTAAQRIKALPRVHAVPIDQLETAIEDLLTRQPHTVAQLSAALGFAEETIRKRLGWLEEVDRVHRISNKPGGSGARLENIWRIGEFVPSVEFPSQNLRKDQIKTVKSDKGEKPRQPTIKIYPPIGRRDELVSALFGPARSAA